MKLTLLKREQVLLDRFGISSIQAIKLLSWLESNYGGNLSIEHLSREGMSIRTLANTVQLAASGNLVPAVDIPREVREIAKSILLDLRQRVCSTPAYRESPADSLSTVFLTGAIGFLGIGILRQVLEQPTPRSLLRALSAAGHKWEGAWKRRVVVWPGDLSQPQLSLQKGHWEELTNGTINRSIHNGALAVNVLATVRSLQIMNSSSCAVNFVYASGGQRFNPAQELSKALRISQAAKSTGYSQSKIVSELIVSRVADEFQKRLVAGAMDAGIRSSGHDDEWTYVCDVEQAAKQVVNSSGILFPSMRSTEDSHVTTIMDGIYLRDL
ncbi:uncharacterized protein B0J16DRAFT_322460 [Fusarium flagelliforme]|uniref:uncharacterized protein n=1 Tax=Fusarium flagelliforme TaxID=2675880 RepID=UPI001E8CA426|nr:uncharacterized protein B0J16DRAFT_322460 [Fusarium flagelliforme]KAH7178972.1 hypothetical protein B0J16DRAFT_322460 [Fusarium flagelliforme]